MIMVKENEEELCWKFRNGDLVPISKLTEEQLTTCRNNSLTSMEYHFKQMNVFTDLNSALELEIENRISKIKRQLEYLEFHNTHDNINSNVNTENYGKSNEA